MVFEGHNLWLGVLAAVVVGMLMGVLKAFVSVTMQALQGISGIGLYLFGLGLSSLLFKTLIGSVEGVSGFRQVGIPLLSDLPGIGHILFNHNVLVYLAYLMVPVSWFVINRTTLGLKIRAVGHNPEAADTLGVSVNGVRYTTMMIGGALAGVAGASLSIGLQNVFQENMTNGLGFIAVALVYFGSWRMVGGAGWLAAVQPGQCSSAMDTGAEHSGSVGSGRDDALHYDDRGACLHRATDSTAGGPRQIV